MLRSYSCSNSSLCLLQECIIYMQRPRSKLSTEISSPEMVLFLVLMIVFPKVLKVVNHKIYYVVTTRNCFVQHILEPVYCSYQTNTGRPA